MKNKYFLGTFSKYEFDPGTVYPIIHSFSDLANNDIIN